MATYYLITPVKTSGGIMKPGTLIDDAVWDIDMLQAAGGVLRSSADEVVAAAAAVALACLARSGSMEEMTAIMVSALAFSDASDAEGLADTIVVADAAAAAIAVLQAGILQKRTATIGFATVAAKGAVASGTFNVGAVLPANARIMGVELTGTAFAGGSVSAMALDVGGTDADALVAAADAFTGAVFPKHGTAGINPNGNLSAQQLVATLTATDGLLNAITSGSVVVTVTFMVLA